MLYLLCDVDDRAQAARPRAEFAMGRRGLPELGRATVKGLGANASLATRKRLKSRQLNVRKAKLGITGGRKAMGAMQVQAQIRSNAPKKARNTARVKQTLKQIGGLNKPAINALRTGKGKLSALQKGLKTLVNNRFGVRK